MQQNLRGKTNKGEKQTTSKNYKRSAAKNSTEPIKKQKRETLKTTKENRTKWTTKAGNSSTHRKCEITYTLLALHKHRQITWNCYVDESNAKSISYDLIISRDLLHQIEIEICFSAAEVRWDNASIPMQTVDKSAEEFEQELLFAQDPLATDAERIQSIVERKYCPAN
jgi:hypothetical protein